MTKELHKAAESYHIAHCPGPLQTILPHETFARRHIEARRSDDINDSLSSVDYGHQYAFRLSHSHKNVWNQ